MKRKALFGILVICLMLVTVPISCSAVNDDLPIKIPDNLPTGQNLVKTGGEESIHENIGRHFPSYTGCKAYFYSGEGRTAILVCTFNSENDAKGDLQNLISNDPDVMLLSDFVGEYREELKSAAPSYLDCDIPDICMIGEFDGILFPLGKNIVWVSSEGEEALYMLEIAEAVYTLNVGDTSPSKPETSDVTEEEKGAGFDNDFLFEMPDELSTGQKLIKTGGEEVLGEEVGEIFPNYIGCKEYVYSNNSSLSKYPPSKGETVIIVSAFSTEKEARNKFQNFLTNAPSAMPLSDFIEKNPEMFEEYPQYLQSALKLNSTVPDVYTGGDGDVVLFPLGNKIVFVGGEEFYAVAETIYLLNDEASSSSEGTPAFEAVFAITGLLAVAYVLSKSNKRRR